MANVAARVQALAEPGAVLVTARVQREVAGLFVAEERGTHVLKGVPEPVALYRLVRASGGGRRSGQRQLTSLIGRNDEITMLIRRWERARQGDGQLVMIVGEPGLGKSRLIEEFHSRLSDTPHTWVEWSCSQLLQNTPLHPIAEWGRQRFGGGDVSAERRLAELESSLAQVKLDPAENVPLLAPLLDIPLPPDRAPALAAEELRRRQLAALTNWVLAGARVQPVVLAFEDLHWADPTTLDVLRGIAERGALAPLFVVATTRPEFRPSWGMRSHHGTISLAPLDRAQVRDMVAELSARHALPQRSGGGCRRAHRRRSAVRRGSDAAPPGARRARRHPRHPADAAAVFDGAARPSRPGARGGADRRGDRTWLLLRPLRAIAGMDDAPLQAALEKLADADIVLVQGLPPESEYRFKHALIQDAAYENLLKSRRQTLHRRVAEMLRDRFADTAAAEPEALAHHFTQAGMTDAAIEWWGKAGDQALRRSAFQEAISHLGKAIEMADKAGEARLVRRAAAFGRPTIELQQIRPGRGVVARAMHAPGNAAAFTARRELGGGADNPTSDSRTTTDYGSTAMCAANWRLRGRPQRLSFAKPRARARIAGSRGCPSASMARPCIAGKFYGGASSSRESAFDLRSQRRSGPSFVSPGHPASATTISLVLLALGEIDRARELSDQAVARADWPITTLTNVYAHFKARFRNDPADAAAAGSPHEALVELSRAHELALYLAYRRISLPGRARGSATETGIADLREGLAH